MKLYSSKLAPSPLKVVIFLKEKGILDQVEIVNLDLGKLEHKTPEYKAIAPNSRVPALQLDDGTIILETTVKINAIPILSNIVGCNPNSGKINNCISTARIKPLPTSMILSNISFFII